MLSVVIPTFNEEHYIGKLLKSLRGQTFKDIEIIVADNQSEDKTRTIAKTYKAKIVQGGHQGFGRNNGAKSSNGKIILFLDADVTLSKDFIEKGLKEFEEKKADIACCYFDAQGFSISMWILYSLWNSSKYVRRETKFPDGEGQCMWVKKSVFKKIGGFDEKLKIAEDVDFVQRAAQMGFHYEVLTTRFIPSCRRYKNVSAIRVMLGSFIGGIEQLVGKKTTGRYAELIYGGWGKH